MKRLVLAPEAKVDLRDIGRYIASDHPDRARQTVEQIERRARRIAEAPLSYRERRELSPGLRAVGYGSYMIFYRDLPDEVRVVRIVHGARDLTALFSQS